MTTLNQFSRTPLAFLPTPLHSLDRLAEALGHKHLYIKRDDMTGLALGGNKTRKLEFLMAEAINLRANVILTAGAPQSNHCRQTAAAARKIGIRCILVFTAGKHDELQGNVLLDHLFNAEIERINHDDTLSAMTEIAKREKLRGFTPYIIPVGGSNALGCLGYAQALVEIDQQLKTQKLQAHHLYFSSGSGGTQGGLILGKYLAQSSINIIGVSPSRKTDEVAQKVVDTANAGAQLLQLNFAICAIRRHCA
jgi:1-aminocyclopropane-1-carboxylate deaminase/D-cysteine desulfhydrase-like pyridoxal-dependent ACC family enzyme